MLACALLLGLHRHCACPLNPPARTHTHEKQSASVLAPFLIDFDYARSYVLYDAAGAPCGCGALRPPMPDFPPE